jgi:glycosyltransferase involved in cell wall biosynthesis
MSELARRWKDAGHEVHVLSGMPCYPTGIIPEAYAGRAFVHEEREGVRVHRTWVYAAPNAGVVRRGAYYASLAGSLMVGQLAVPRPDVVVATSPHILAAVAGALVARFNDAPLVLDVRDLWPRVIWELGVVGRDHPMVQVLERVEAWLYRQAATVVTVTRSFREDMLDRFAHLDVQVITNGVDLARFDPVDDGRAARERLGLPLDATVVLYAGNHGMSQGLGAVVEAARRVDDVRFVFLGEGAEKARLVAEAGDLDHVSFHPAVPAREMPGIYAMADVCLVPLRDLPVFRRTIPSKIFEIWGARRCLVLGVLGEAADIVRRCGGGRIAQPEDPESLATVIRELADDPESRDQMGSAGRDCVEAEYDRDRLAERYLEVLADAIGH